MFQRTQTKQRKKQVNCMGCRHFFITHEVNHRYGCRRFGFKGPAMPSQTVLRSSGTECAYREPRLSARQHPNL